MDDTYDLFVNEVVDRYFKSRTFDLTIGSPDSYLIEWKVKPENIDFGSENEINIEAPYINLCIDLDNVIDIKCTQDEGNNIYTFYFKDDTSLSFA